MNRSAITAMAVDFGIQRLRLLVSKYLAEC
jgi:hypothetical protein